MDNFVFPACQPKYIRDQKGAGFQLNAIPVQYISNYLYRLYFPRPWILVGLVTLDTTLPLPVPSWFASYANPLAPVLQSDYVDMLNAVFLDCAFANCEPEDPLKPVNYVAPGPQGVDYRGYFSKYLSEETLSTRQETYNSIIQPQSIIKKFMNDNALATSIDWHERWKNTVKFLEKTSYVNWWGAPGIYDIAKPDVEFFGYPTWQFEFNYQTIQNA